MAGQQVVNAVSTVPSDVTDEKLVFNQVHEELVLDETWWWSVKLTLCSVAIIGNLLFLITIIYNRKRHDLKTFVTAIIITLAALDVIDVIRIIPVLVKELFNEEVFRHVYCTLGVFHELSVAIFLISLSIAVCIQAGRSETKYYTGAGDPKASKAQKILIPAVLLLAAGVACPLFLLPYEKLSHTCTDPFRATKITNTSSDTFYSDLYSTIVSSITYVLPLLVLPLALPIACFRTCISRQCCVPRFKQPIGELVMSVVVCLVYIGTVVGVILPRLDKALELNKVVYGKAPLLWELANNAARPLCYFMMNPGVWDGLGALCGCCCKKKHTLVNSDDDDEETEIPLSPVTTV